MRITSCLIFTEFVVIQLGYWCADCAMLYARRLLAECRRLVVGCWLLVARWVRIDCGSLVAKRRLLADCWSVGIDRVLIVD